LAAGTLDYPDLLAAARDFHGRIAGTPVAGIAARLHEVVRALAHL
jgi:hypothetical protein